MICIHLEPFYSQIEKDISLKQEIYLQLLLTKRDIFIIIIKKKKILTIVQKWLTIIPMTKARIGWQHPFPEPLGRNRRKQRSCFSPAFPRLSLYRHEQ